MLVYIIYILINWLTHAFKNNFFEFNVNTIMFINFIISLPSDIVPIYKNMLYAY